MAYARLPSLLGKALIGVIKMILTQQVTHCITNMTGVMSVVITGLLFNKLSRILQRLRITDKAFVRPPNAVLCSEKVGEHYCAALVAISAWIAFNQVHQSASSFAIFSSTSA